MDPNFWHDRWANNELGWHERDFHPQLTAHFHQLALPAGSRVFVPLCGKTRDIVWLLQQGYAVVGIELSELAVQQLFSELGVQAEVTQHAALLCYSAPGLNVFVGDIFQLTPQLLGKVDASYDRAALVALPPAMRDSYAQHMLAVTQQAPQLLICFEYDQKIMAGPPHSVNAAEIWRHYGTTYRLQLVDVRAVAGGLKGQTPADELAWIAQPRAAR